MFANVTLRPVRETGWRSGLSNLMSYESARWWHSTRWLVHAVIWLILINGLMAAFLWAPVDQLGDAPALEHGNNVQIELTDPLEGGLTLFLVMGGTATGIGIILVMQGAIVDEKKRGTVGWILSKPVSRSAFILSKLVVNAVAALVLMVLLQGLIAYGLLTARIGNAPPLLPFLAGLALFGLHLLFYLTLTLMLGTFFEERGPVIAIPLVLLIGAQLVQGMFPALSPLTPWELLQPGPATAPVALQVMLQVPLTTYTPIIATVTWVVLFVFVAVWKFRREES